MADLEFDEQMMRRCLELASLGISYAFPNPLVGSVITVNKKIISEGYHQKYGEAHAEVNAIAPVLKNPELKNILRDASLYVNLEPCCHHGKTGPCTELIINSSIKKVIVGTRDCDERVSGKGIKQLSSHGIKVIENILEKECKFLNRRFFVFKTFKRPYIILKWAETADGFMAPEQPSKKWISSEAANVYSHKWRTEETGILIGYNTALIDNPYLTARLVSGNNPCKILLDPFNNIPKDLNIFQTQNLNPHTGQSETPTFIFYDERFININKSENTNILNFDKNSNIIKIPTNFDDNLVLDVTQKLYTFNIQSFIVEGGKKTLDLFLKSGIFDEIRIIKSKNIRWRNGILSPQIDLKNYNFHKVEELSEDFINYFYLNHYSS